MARSIKVSFKDNARDERLYNIVKGKHDQSAYIKDALEAYEEHTKVVAQRTVVEDDDFVMDIIKD